MAFNLLQLPSPCRSGRFCQTCRSVSADGAAFRAQYRQSHPAMFAADLACAFGLPWNHVGNAPWSDQFAAMIRAQAQQAAVAAMADAPTFGPGDVVKLVLARLGYRPHPNCGCDEFRQQMNEWGWWGCLRRRREVVAWFVSKAREQDIAVADDSVWSLVRAGMRDLLKQRRRGT